MSRYDYFDELSGDDRDQDGEESDSDSSNAAAAAAASSSLTREWDGIHHHNDATDGTNHRIILHADVDCFYCQCEILDRQLDPERPLAIGQKHIIVTCNYAARAMGITKLMDRQKAEEMGGAALLIVNGSDLQRYRIHGRHIYEAFRRCIKGMDPQSRVKRGCMDEMMADITTTTTFAASTSTTKAQVNPHDIFVYENNNNNNNSNNYNHKIDANHHATSAVTITMTEDQSSDATTTTMTRRLLSSDGPNVPEAAIWAGQIRQSILDASGFTVTMGVSYNPMMAKLASGLRKPGTVNVILPPSSSSSSSGSSSRRPPPFIHSMPLRSIHGIGSRTMKLLATCLEQRHGRKSDSNTAPWICRDLLQVPQYQIVQCLNRLPSGPLSSTDRCKEILDLCNGIDHSTIEDDGGTLQKSLSVENSLRQGTIRTKDQVLQVAEDLYRRLPLLLKDRRDFSDHPELAYPTVIRVTARTSLSTGNDQNRRPQQRQFITRSQQSKFAGGRAMCRDGLSPLEAAAVLRQYVTPLLQSLLFQKQTINVTRLNVCVTNFQDVNVPNTNNRSRDGTLNAFIAAPGKSQTP